MSLICSNEAIFYERHVTVLSNDVCGKKADIAVTTIMITKRFQYFLLQNIPFEIIIYIILFELRKAGYIDQIFD